MDSFPLHIFCFFRATGSIFIMIFCANQIDLNFTRPLEKVVYCIRRRSRKYRDRGSPFSKINRSCRFLRVYFQRAKDYSFPADLQLVNGGIWKARAEQQFFLSTTVDSILTKLLIIQNQNGNVESNVKHKFCFLKLPTELKRLWIFIKWRFLSSKKIRYGKESGKNITLAFWTKILPRTLARKFYFVPPRRRDFKFIGTLLFLSELKRSKRGCLTSNA